MSDVAPVTEPQRHDPLPLAGATVLILGDAVAYAGRLLAGMGATVVLIEPLTGCDERRAPPFAPGPLGPSSSLSFAFNAAGLRSVAIDATTNDGAAVLARCIELAEICLDGLAWQPAGAWVKAAAAALAAGDTPVCRLG